MEHRVTYRVYYEDTDSIGVVYHANYLKFMERGRSEFVEATGRTIADWNTSGVTVVVYSMNIKFSKPARLGDRIDVVSAFSVNSDYRGTFRQRVERGGDVLVSAEVEVVCLGSDMKLRELPPEIQKLAD
jgi:tol-pal system-associated acyl-CoA thioesterase